MKKKIFASVCKALRLLEQIVVVDSGSTDATLSIARELGCEIYSEEWRGFGPQKQSAIDKCSESWILVLDADERVPSDTAAIIKKIVNDPQVKEVGFSFPRKNFFQGRWIKHAGWWPDRIVRLFRKEAGRMSAAIVHESVEVQGIIGALDAVIEHYTESRLGKIIQKIDKYSTLGAEAAFQGGKEIQLRRRFSASFLYFHSGLFFSSGYSGRHVRVDIGGHGFC